MASAEFPGPSTSSLGLGLGTGAGAGAGGSNHGQLQGNGGGQGRSGGITPDEGTRTQYQSLRAKVSTRVDSTQQSAQDLQESLAKVRESYKQHLALLKELELERIDLQAAAQWMASTRENWRLQHVSQRIVPSVELDKQLAAEERAMICEARETSTHISKVSAQAQRLRAARDAIERRLTERRQRLRLESNLLDHCDGSLAALDKRQHRRGGSFQVGPRSGSSSARRRSSGEDSTILSHPRGRCAGKRMSDLYASVQLNDGTFGYESGAFPPPPRTAR